MHDEELIMELNKKLFSTDLLNLGNKKDHYPLMGNLYKILMHAQLKDKEDAIEYVKGYDFTAIIDESGNPRNDEAANNQSIFLGYFLIFAANKYGAEFVLKQCLLDSVDLEKHSKLNPINWFLWILGKLAWSEIKANKASASDKDFCSAIKRFQSFKLDPAKNAFEEEFSKDLTLIIQKIAVGYKEELKILNESTPASAPDASAAMTSGNQQNSLPPPALDPITGIPVPPPPPPPELDPVTGIPMPPLPPPSLTQAAGSTPPLPSAGGLQDEINGKKLKPLDKSQCKPPIKQGPSALASEARECLEAMRLRREGGASTLFTSSSGTRDPEPAQSAATLTPTR